MNIVVAQSGGPTAAINATLAGVIKAGFEAGEIETVYGSLHGIEGLINDNLIDISTKVKNDDDIKLLAATPSSALGSCRYKMKNPNEDPSDYEKVFAVMEARNIGAFFYIGGNDSMDTVNKMSIYAKENGKSQRIIGVPKTIDDDLCVTDHTPGFGSAAKYVTTSMKEILCDAEVYDLKSVTIVEIMGRDAGWLTASSVLLRNDGSSAPHLIYLPESDISVQTLISDVKAQLEKHNSVMIALSEGVILDGQATSSSGTVDNFGHLVMSGASKTVEDIVKKEIGCKVRSIELNVMQRCGSHIASKTDIDESLMIGQAAVKAMLNGKTGKMMAFRRVSEDPYKVEIISADTADVANHVKHFPQEWITDHGSNVSDEAIKYFLPLIQGENEVIYENGLPKQIKLK